MRYFLIAGEASGDLHGSNLLKGIYGQDPDATIRFWGGEKMNEVFASCNKSADPKAGIAHDYRDGAVMGLGEILLKAKTLLGNIARCKEDILDFGPDVIILIDYPGFNMKIAKWAHENGIKVFYYIAPKVWASRERRVEKIKKYVDELFIVFPFECPYFDKKGVKYHYFGNPLVDAVAQSNAMTHSREELKQQLGLSPDTPVIAMLAGSRKGEVQTMMPMLTSAAAIMHADPKYAAYKFVIAGAPGRKPEDYGTFDTDYIKVVFGKTQEVVRCAEAAVINSGTASLEAVLLDTPQVVAYRFPTALTNWIAPLVVKVKFISLGNLCLDRLAFKELYRKDNCTGEVVSKELDMLISDKEYRGKMLSEYALIRKMLGAEGASDKVAHKIVELISK